MLSAAVAACSGEAPPVQTEQLPHRTYPAASGVPTPTPDTPVPNVVSALGDRDAPFADTTAEDIAVAAVALGALADDTVIQAGSCVGIIHCRSVASAGEVTLIVFDTTDGAQAWRSTPAATEVGEIGGSRYWSVVDYSTLEPDARSVWREVQRKIIP